MTLVAVATGSPRSPARGMRSIPPARTSSLSLAIGLRYGWIDRPATPPWWPMVEKGMGRAQIGSEGSYWIPRRTSRARPTPARRETR